MQVIEGKLKEELLRIALLRAPYEAVGIISSDGLEVAELLNRREGVEGHFEVSKLNILSTLKNLDDENMSDVTFFHTHPNGGIGPSREDLENKGPFPNHLVLTLIEGDIVHTWY